MPSRDKEKYNEYMKVYMDKRYKQRRSLAIEKLGGKCNGCGSTENLEFDHIDPSTKKFTIACNPCKNEKDFWTEIDKCQLLCSSCHKDKTLEDKGIISAKLRHGTLSTYRYCKCEECKEANRKWSREYKRKRRGSPSWPTGQDS